MQLSAAATLTAATVCCDNSDNDQFTTIDTLTTVCSDNSDNDQFTTVDTLTTVCSDNSDKPSPPRVPCLSQPLAAVPQQITTTMTKKAQKTILDYITKVDNKPPDPYCYSRRYMRVYDKAEISSREGKIGQEYLQFWNDEGKRLVERGITKKSNLEALIKHNWNRQGRFEACIKFGKVTAQMYEMKDNWDHKYQSRYEELLKKLEEKEKEKLSVIEEKEDRIKTGHMSKKDRVHMQKHTDKVTDEIEGLNNQLQKVAKNWATILNKTNRNGPKTGKPGRKRTLERKDVQYKTARELKAKRKVVYNINTFNY